MPAALCAAPKSARAFAELEILARGKPSDALGADDTDPVAAQLEMEAAD